MRLSKYSFISYFKFWSLNIHFSLMILIYHIYQYTYHHGIWRHFQSVLDTIMLNHSNHWFVCALPPIYHVNTCTFCGLQLYKPMVCTTVSQNCVYIKTGRCTYNVGKADLQKKYSGMLNMSSYTDNMKGKTVCCVHWLAWSLG